MNHNVSIILLFGLLTFVLGTLNKEEEEAKKQKCIAETGVNPELAEWALMKEPTSDPKNKCYRVCYMIASGDLKADGTLELGKILAKIQADHPQKVTYEAMYTKCAAKKGSNECETGYEIMMCIYESKTALLKERSHAIKQKCITESGVDTKLPGLSVMKLRISDPKAKCYRACTLRLTGYLKADGTYDFDREFASIPANHPEKDTIIANLKECASKTGVNECETVYENYTCILEKKIPEAIRRMSKTS